jgi:hypothetical protein
MALQLLSRFRTALLMRTTQSPKGGNRNKASRIFMFSLSSEEASFWFDFSNIILLVGALLVLVGTYGAFKTGSIKERFSDERASSNELLTASANKLPQMQMNAQQK